jgi:hypothetical protein
MIPSPDNYGFLQVDRPILDGERFLSKARALGIRTLGQTFVSSLTEIYIDDSDENQPDRLMHVEVPIAEPVLRVCSDEDFSMVLLNRAVSKERASRHSLGYVQGKMAKSTVSHRTITHDGIAQRAKVSLPGLSDQLDQLASDYNIDPNDSPVICDHIEQIHPIGDTIVLGLSPRVGDDATHLLHEQSLASLQRLREVSPRTANIAPSCQLTAPFARVPNGVGDRAYQLLLDELDQLTPVYLTLGPAEFSSRDRPRGRL